MKCLFRSMPYFPSKDCEVEFRYGHFLSVCADPHGMSHFDESAVRVVVLATYSSIGDVSRDD